MLRNRKEMMPGTMYSIYMAEGVLLWYIYSVPKRTEDFDMPLIFEDAFKRMVNPSPQQGSKRRTTGNGTK
jgi:hypothetical protein